MNHALACIFCHATLAQGALLLEKNNAALCRPCCESFAAQFSEHAWHMACTAEEQLDVLLCESQRALKHSETLAERARACGLNLETLAAVPRRPLS